MSRPSTEAALLAQAFHEAYERLAPSFGYETREASAVPWDDVPEPNRSLMVAVVGEVLAPLLVRVETLEAALNLATKRCPLCTHDWTQHDPEDGKCDAGTCGGRQTGFGPCMCGREPEYHRRRNAAISTAALSARADARIARAAPDPSAAEPPEEER